MYLNSLKNIAKVSVAFALSLVAMVNTSEAQAQDLIARQAPIDRKMKAVDSVVINKAITRQQAPAEINFEQTDLYSTWDTKTVHCYGKQQTPDRYTIDLRGYAMPTPSKVVTSNFGYRASFGRMHKGLDIKVYIGDTIVSAFDGKVRIVNYEAKGYGNYVVIRHNNGLETIYGHLSKHLCKTGDVVRAGQPIGLGGNTGRSTGSHLHFETRILGEAINPALLFDFVHQDVTGDFFEYRRNGSGAVVAAKPKTTPAPVAKAAPAKTPTKAATPAAPAKTNAPTKAAPATAKAPAKAAAPATQATAKASTPAASPKVKTKAADAPAQGKATAKAAAPAPAAKTAPAQGKATAKAAAPAPAAKAVPAQGKATAKAAAPAPAAKSAPAPAKTPAKAATPAAPAQGKATAKAAAPAPAAKGGKAAPAQGKASTSTPKAAPAQGKASTAAPKTAPKAAPKGGKATASAGKAQGKTKA